ncbi:MAG: FHA domain-containing protein [Acidobacteriia bacterium]|nr:FHA domain-containing protein [Terriglobia bacterium]
MSLFSELEKSIESGFRRWTERAFGPAQSGDLVVVHRAILEQIEDKVQIVARGRRIFPYPRVLVTLVSPDPERRALYQAAFGDRLGPAVREALEGAGCELPRTFAVEVRTADTGTEPFSIEYSADVLQQPAPAAAPARIVVVRGKAQQDTYALTKARTNIGRLAELTDAEQRVIRRNDLVFEEGADEANSTVSRKHAHIRYENSEYRMCDDGSEYGTRVFRDGRSIEVPRGDRRGEKLRPGDEIYVGRACLRFEQ